MRIILFLGYCVVAILATIFIGIYYGIIDPIMSVAEMIDTNTVTATGIGWEFCKFLLRGVITVVVGWGFFILGVFIKPKSL